MTVFQGFLSSWGNNAQASLFLAGYLNLDFGVHIHEMGIIPICHSTVVMIKTLEELRKNFMGKCRFKAGHVGTRKGEIVRTEAGSRDGVEY